MQGFSVYTDPFRLIIHGRESRTEEEEEGSKANQSKERIDTLGECATGCGDDLCFNIEFRDAIHGAVCGRKLATSPPYACRASSRGSFRQRPVNFLPEVR